MKIKQFKKIPLKDIVLCLVEEQKKMKEHLDMISTYVYKGNVTYHTSYDNTCNDDTICYVRKWNDFKSRRASIERIDDESLIIE